MSFDEFLLKSGTLLHERYRIDKTIKHGSFGGIYAAQDTVLDRSVAVKEYYPRHMVYRDQGSTDVKTFDTHIDWFAARRKTLMERIRVIFSVGNLPNTAQLYDVFEENGTVYIVSEFVEGEKLDDLVKRCGTMPLKKAAELLLPIAEDLSALHAKGIVHEEINPWNVVIRKGTRQAVLMDLGEGSFKDEFFQTADWDGPLILQPFKAVEQKADTLELDGRTDEYAFCAVLYFLTTGKKPEEAWNRLAGKELETPRALGADMDEGCEAVLLKGLSVHREARYGSIAELCEALREAMPDLKGPVTVAADVTEDDGFKAARRAKTQNSVLTGEHGVRGAEDKFRGFLVDGTAFSGEYQIVRPIGKGGFGYTYAGYDMVYERRVVIREYCPSVVAHRSDYSTRIEPGNDPVFERIFDEGRRRSYQEAVRAYGMKNLMRVAALYDIIVKNDTMYAVMEYVEGETLLDFIGRRGKLTYQEAADLLFPLLPDLIRMHEQGGMHNNISPKNIMISKDTGEAVLLDFGAAFCWYDYLRADITSGCGIRPGRFATVEQCSLPSARLDGRTDEFSFCSALYYALTGKAVGGYSKIEAPSKLGVDIPPEAEAALMRGLAKDREQRFESVKELCKALRVDMDKLPKAPVMPDINVHMEECFIQLDDTSNGTDEGNSGTAKQNSAHNGAPVKQPVTQEKTQEKTQEARPPKKKGNGGRVALCLLAALAVIGVCVAAGVYLLR